MNYRELGPVEIIWPKRRRTGWYVTLHFAEIDGRAECIGIDVRSFHKSEFPPSYPKPITRQFLCSLPVAELIEKARRSKVANLRALVEIGPGDEAEGWAEEITPFLEAAPTKVGKGRAGRPVTRGPDHYRRVAEIYRTAPTNAPTKAVAEAFGVARGTAATWVGRARKQGYLGPAQQGRAGSFGKGRR